MEFRTYLAAAAGILATLLTACTTTLNHGGHPPSSSASLRIFLPPFHNATDDDHAARALTEITATLLLEQGLPLVQNEAALTQSRTETAPGEKGLFLEAAREVQATHLLVGTVHEYRYKTDLDGDPVVGISLRLVDAASGETLWQSTASRTGVFFSSLSKVSQIAVRDLLRKLPLPRPDKKHTAANSVSENTTAALGPLPRLLRSR